MKYYTFVFNSSPFPAKFHIISFIICPIYNCDISRSQTSVFFIWAYVLYTGLDNKYISLWYLYGWLLAILSYNALAIPELPGLKCIFISWLTEQLLLMSKIDHKNNKINSFRHNWQLSHLSLHYIFYSYIVEAQWGISYQ